MLIPEGNAYCAVGRPRSALWSAAISRNGRGSQDRRPRVMTLVCQSPPYVGRGGKLACPRTAAPVISQTDHQRDRRAPPRGARRATSAAVRWGPLQSRNASPTLPTLTPLAPRRCTARANAPPPPSGAARRSTLLSSPPCTRANIVSCVIQHHPCMRCLRAPALAPRRPCHPIVRRPAATARGSSGATRRSTCAPSNTPAVLNATIIAAGVAHRRRRRSPLASLAASTKRHRPSRSRSRSRSRSAIEAVALAVAER